MLWKYRYQKNKPLGGIGGPIDDTLKIWEVVIPGPKDSPFEGGKFKVKITKIYTSKI